MIGKPHRGFVLGPKPGEITIGSTKSDFLPGRISIAPVEDHQDERIAPGSVEYGDTEIPDLGTPPREPAWADDCEELYGKFGELVAKTDKRLSGIEQQLTHAPDAQFARSLLDFNERLTRIEKQIAFMSNAQAMQERQIALHKRATGLDMAIKACPGQDAGEITMTAEAFVIWLEPGVSG